VEPIRSHRADLPSRAPTRGGPAASDDGESVYPPREDSRLLLPFVNVAPGTLLADVGTGSGLAALAAARAGAHVVATDRNPHALRRLRRLARADGLEIALVRTDLLDGLTRFDRVLANPPYLPTRPEQRDPDRWHNLALDGGPDGCRVTGRLVAALDQHLTADGSAYLVVSSLQDPVALRRIRAAWQARGGSVEVAGARELEGERLEVWRLWVRPR
jgi:release factor glutamine methyltransferase